jgi:hypothetical protein
MQPDQRVASVIRRVRLTIFWSILSLHCFDQKAYALAEIAGANGTIAAANVSAAIPARVFERDERHDLPPSPVWKIVAVNDR